MQSLENPLDIYQKTHYCEDKELHCLVLYCNSEKASKSIWLNLGGHC